jgi:acyl dehydratase
MKENMKHPKLWLDDLKTGQRFDSDSVTIERDEIIAFAQKYDPQPFHTDEAAAGASLFKGLTASGAHTYALSMSLLARSAFSLGGGIIGTGGDLRWTKPVRPGDTLRLRIDIIDVSQSNGSPNRGQVAIHIETLNQKDEIVQTFDTKLTVFNAPAPRDSNS